MKNFDEFGNVIVGRDVMPFRHHALEPSIVEPFLAFKALWEKETKDIKNKKELEHLLFVVVYPDKLKWAFHIEKQLQTTTIQTSGGVTGAGTGHNQILCLESELHNTLQNSKASHAMIVTVGMVFNMTKVNTSITRFYEFAETDVYARGHIIARPEDKAYLHHQHIEINLNQWKGLGSPKVYERWPVFERSEENFHDDYTPHWILPKDRPLINNFTAEERNNKHFAYHMANRRDIQEINWRAMTPQLPDYWWKSAATFKHTPKGRGFYGWRQRVDRSDPYFEILMNRMTEVFYAENTEEVGQLPTDKFDLIITPTAGYSGEVFAEKLDFDGEIIFYDYCHENVEIKKSIVDMNMSLDEISILKKYWSKGVGNRKNGTTRTHMITFNSNQLSNGKELKKRSETFGTWEELQALQGKMSDNYKVDFWLMDLVCMSDPDWYRPANIYSDHSDIHNKSGYTTTENFIDKIKGKRVFMDCSNIFGYHIVHACWSLSQLVESYERLVKLLQENTEYFYLKGTRPGKQKIRI